ncbi:hypothetical protein HY224_03480 [Candidatus Uhrbacteria bacterium]|nr:hypothetical protein [Candidatus Uhrbacteria bacterium]
MDLVVSNDEETLRQGLGARVLSYQLLCQRGEKPFEHLRKEFPATPFGVFCWSNCDWPGWDCPDLTKMAQRIAELDRSLRPAQAPTGSRRA